MPTATAGEKIVLHCFQCRARTEHERMPLSRPVFKCVGCGNTREVEELGRGEIPTPASQPRPKPAPITVPKETTVMADEPKFRRSPLQSAIAAEISGQLDAIRAEMKALKKEIDDRDDAGASKVSDKDLERKLNQVLEEQLPDLINRAVLQMLATPASGEPVRRTRQAKADAPAAGDPDGCRHKNNMKACKHCQAKRAAAEA